MHQFENLGQYLMLMYLLRPLIFTDIICNSLDNVKNRCITAVCQNKYQLPVLCSFHKTFTNCN